MVRHVLLRTWRCNSWEIFLSISLHGGVIDPKPKDAQAPSPFLGQPQEILDQLRLRACEERREFKSTYYTQKAVLRPSKKPK